MSSVYESISELYLSTLEEGLCKHRFLRSARISVTVDPFFYDLNNLKPFGLSQGGSERAVGSKRH